MESDIERIKTIGNDLQMSIEDLIYHIKTIKEDVEKLKSEKLENN
jgi:hypothetical protein